MKKILLPLLAIVLFQIGMNAQPPQGGGRMGGGNRGGAPGRGMMPQGEVSKDELVLEYFPEIPGITLEQRAKMSELLAKEQKEVLKRHEQMRKNDESFRQKENPSEKEVAKHRKQEEKLRKQIESVKEKSDKKIVKVLSQEQYRVFKEKREEFRFRHNRGGMMQPRQHDGRGQGDGGRPPRPTM